MAHQPKQRRKTSYKIIITQLNENNNNNYNEHEETEEEDQNYKLEPLLKNEDIKPELFTCGFCDASFVTQMSLKRHMVYYHENDPTFICSICQEIFYKEIELDKHKKMNKHCGPGPDSKAAKVKSEPVATEEDFEMDEHDGNQLQETEYDSDDEKIPLHLNGLDEPETMTNQEEDNPDLPKYKNLFENYEEEDEEDNYMQLIEDPLDLGENNNNNYYNDDDEDEQEEFGNITNNNNETFQTQNQTATMQMQTQKPPVKMQIPLLGLVPPQKANIESINTSLNGIKVERNNICQECGATFASRVNLTRHIQIHSQERPHVCNLCNKAFLRKEHLLKHLSSVHSGLKFRCEFCKKEISRKDHLIRHIRNVHPTEYIGLPAEIQEIERQTLESLSLTNLQAAGFVLSEKALESLQPKPKKPYFNCDLCNETFLQIDDLHAHQSDVHRDVRRFKCPEPECPKAFKRKEHLVKHSVVHSGEKKFNCNNCQKSFPRKDALQDHIRRVHVIGQTTCIEYPCNLCEKIFLQRVNLIRHLKNVHGIVVNMQQSTTITTSPPQAAVQPAFAKIFNLPPGRLVRPPQPITIRQKQQQPQFKQALKRPAEQLSPSAAQLLHQTQQRLNKISKGNINITISPSVTSSSNTMANIRQQQQQQQFQPKPFQINTKNGSKISPSSAITIRNLQQQQIRPRFPIMPMQRAPHSQRNNLMGAVPRVISFP